MPQSRKVRSSTCHSPCSLRLTKPVPAQVEVLQLLPMLTCFHQHPRPLAPNAAFFKVEACQLRKAWGCSSECACKVCPGRADGASAAELQQSQARELGGEVEQL